MINTTSESFKAKKGLFYYLSFYEQLKFYAQVSMIKFYNHEVSVKVHLFHISYILCICDSKLELTYA